MHPCALTDEQLLRDIDVERFRSSGPGGQHLNKTESGVRLTHRATGLRAECQDHRDRLSNQADALLRLRLRLACAQRGGSDPAWIANHRRGSRLELSPRARDLHLVAAALLDALVAAQGSLAEAAAALGLSTTQLAKAFCIDRELHAAADAVRAAHGLRAIEAR